MPEYDWSEFELAEPIDASTADSTEHDWSEFELAYPPPSLEKQKAELLVKQNGGEYDWSEFELAYPPEKQIAEPSSNQTPEGLALSFNEQILAIEKYHKSLPYPMDSYTGIDEVTHDRYIHLNELATGSPYRFSENKIERQEEIDRELIAMQQQGIPSDPSKRVLGRAVNRVAG